VSVVIDDHEQPARAMGLEQRSARVWVLSDMQRQYESVYIRRGPGRSGQEYDPGRTKK